MRRRAQKPRRGGENQHRVNHQIRIPQIRVIGSDGEQLGIMSPREALSLAEDQDYDLVEVAPKARPPVCRIMDYGKFRYDQSKKASGNKSSKSGLKTLKLRPKTDTHDLETLMRKARSFLEKGDKVKLVMQLRGREQAHTRLWIDKLNDLLYDLREVSNVIQTPRVEGRMITAMLEQVGDPTMS
ncbi:MAG: translation initiation factor IF-3 [Candidatus Altiarchaeales archaeon]|nr:translation initiation factor IF-3 [Candidatus Altiarchaeales archaeon]